MTAKSESRLRQIATKAWRPAFLIAAIGIGWIQVGPVVKFRKFLDNPDAQQVGSSMPVPCKAPMVGYDCTRDNSPDQR